MISSLLDIMHLIDEYSAYLDCHGIILDSHGFPRLDKTAYLAEWPSTIVPYRHRLARSTTRKQSTVLCLYCDDRHIYPRLEKVLAEIESYRPFMGVIGADVTVTSDMDVEWQAATMLLNHLFTAVLASNGIKIVANIRCGSEETLGYLSCIPHGVMCASGFLGCANTSSKLDYSYVAKVLTVMPSKLLIYGKRDAVVECQLNELGIDYRRYADFHSQSLTLRRQ